MWVSFLTTSDVWQELLMIKSREVCASTVGLFKFEQSAKLGSKLPRCETAGSPPTVSPNQLL